jgi:signal peptidase II
VAGLVGGAIGNLIDRFTLGYVLDFIDMGIGSSRFWTFNVADMGITIGICLLFADGLLPAKSRWRLS